MIDSTFDHDRLDVYRLSIEYTAEAFVVAKDLSGLHRHARDQWLRAAQSIPLKIAEGNGKRSLKDRARFFDIARGSSFECAAIQDVLVATGGGRAPGYREEHAQAVMDQKEIVLRVRLNRGRAAMTLWTCDLSHEYVSINSEYRS